MYCVLNCVQANTVKGYGWVKGYVLYAFLLWSVLNCVQANTVKGYGWVKGYVLYAFLLWSVCTVYHRSSFQTLDIFITALI